MELWVDNNTSGDWLHLFIFSQSFIPPSDSQSVSCTLVLFVSSLGVSSLSLPQSLSLCPLAPQAPTDESSGDGSISVVAVAEYFMMC